MTIDITLEEAYSRASDRLRCRMEHSIDLLRKAERLALRYDSTDGFFLAFSGGKDSQALLHIAQLAGVRFRAHMNFTSVDPPQVVRFVRQQYPEVVTHAPRKSIYNLAVERAILPSMRIRWCCADLKEQAGAGKVTLIGIRKQESVRRSKRNEVEVSNRQFSGGYDDFLLWQETKLKEKEEKLLRKMKREGKKVNEDWFTADKENEVRCIGGKDSILVSPIIDWTEQDVWEFLNDVAQVPHCVLYDQGYTRIGCILCPMSSPRQKQREIKDFPHVKRGWIRAIKEIRRRGGISRRLYMVEYPSRLEPGQQRQPQAQPLEKLPPPQECSTRRRDSAIGSGSTRMGNSCRQKWRDAAREGPARKTGIFNGKMAYFRSGNIHGFQDIGRGKPIRASGAGFSDSPSAGGSVEGQAPEPTEDEIAEAIFDWWISGKSYSRWYAEKFLQTSLDLKND